MLVRILVRVRFRVKLCSVMGQLVPIRIRFIVKLCSVIGVRVRVRITVRVRIRVSVKLCSGRRPSNDSGTSFPPVFTMNAESS